MLFWQALLLHDNWLSGIDRPERLHDFRTLRVCLHYIYTLMPSWWNLLLPVLFFPPIVTCIIFPSHCYLYYYSLPLLPVLLFPPIVTCIIFPSHCYLYYYSLPLLPVLFSPPIVTCIISPSHCYLYYYSLPLLPVLLFPPPFGGRYSETWLNKCNNKITELRTILQRESQNS